MFISQNRYIQVPLMKIVFPYVLGMLFSLYYSNLWIVNFAFFSFVFLYFLNRYISKSKKIIKFKISSVFNLLTLFVFFLLAYNVNFFFNKINYKKHFSKFILKSYKNDCQIKVLEVPVEKNNSYKLVAEVIKVKSVNSIKSTNGKIIIYIEKDTLLKKIQLGDILNIKANITKIESSKNPNEFNYKEYLKFKNIHFQTYLKYRYWKKINLKQNNVFQNKLLTLKNHLQYLIKKYIDGKDEQAIASALLIGNRNLLDKEILRAFSSSGATHILAVSGLHVGIFYILISFLFRWMKKFKRLRYVYSFITISFIWFYVLLTGGSPSVIRAATMFSLFAIGESSKRFFSVFNIIAFSVILQVSFNPNIVTEVGFQLSYFAVIGIIFLQPKIYRLINIKNYVGDKIWAITTVSFAAQISTIPLITLYFHQFPNLFFISNLAVIPAASIILIGGIILFIVSFNNFLASFVGDVLNFIIQCLTILLKWIEEIPYSLTTGLYISHFQAFLFYLLIIWSIIAFVKRSKILFKYSMFLLVILSVSFSYKYVKTINQELLTVYHAPNFSAIEIISKNIAYEKFDSKLLQDESQMLFRVNHNRWEKQISKILKIKISKIKKNSVISFKAKKILLIDSIFSIPKNPIKFNYTIISHSPKLYLKSFTKNIDCKKYIFDTSNDKKFVKYWKKDCLDLGLDCYFVSDSFAFVTDKIDRFNAF